MLLRLLCTPSPSIAELRWKIEVLLSEDCGCDAEEKGWLMSKMNCSGLLIVGRV